MKGGIPRQRRGKGVVKMKYKAQQAKRKTTILIKKLILLVTSYLLLVTLIGCDAFVRKFTRRRKKENLPQEEMVLVPEEYKAPVVAKDELYRQYFFFWKSWHDELIQALTTGASHKKQIDCANEAIKNLQQLKALLKPEKQKQLDTYVNQLNDLKESIAKDIYGMRIAGNCSTAERIKRNILRDLSLPGIKDCLI